MQASVTAEQVQSLIDAGAQVNDEDDGRNALEVAVERGLGADILTVLIDNGADPERTPMILHSLLVSDAVTVEKVKALVDAGASTTAENDSGQTPLDLARELGLDEAILNLLGPNATVE